ncbi:uncharacterized protein IL334_004127 [Kwoniella shivajii]|uniref:non-specific serine/threonine protein kinase n=1 Tax=Kwoniella shivajii TaxID=564305 RepID=A0ABZ1D2H6_9TREE|nr:hypothetical protein IL334_004127 [Kwoniella shivajii]
MNTNSSDNLAIALDRFKFYARDAVLTLTQLPAILFSGQSSRHHRFVLGHRQPHARTQATGAISRDMPSVSQRYENLADGSVRAMHQYHLSGISASYPPTREDDPLVAEPVFDHDEELANAEQGELIPYAHRDIKPAAQITVETRQQALLEQDIASEHSSMPYRAPELFDVKTGKMLDEKVDIWIDGTSIAMAVGSGRYRHPGGYSPKFVSLIDSMLVVDPEQRPDIQKVRDETRHGADVLGDRPHGASNTLIIDSFWHSSPAIAYLLHAPSSVFAYDL